MARFQTLVDALQHWSQDRPHYPAVVFRNKRHERHVLTWEALYTLSGRFAAVLRSEGTGRGTLVLNTLPNSPERVVCEAGIWMSGAASVSGRYLQADVSDLLTTVQKSRAPVILLDPDLQDGPWSVLKKHVVLGENNAVTLTSSPHLRKVLFVQRVENQGPGDFLSGLEARTEWFQAKDLSPDDRLSVFSTSGTTGFSKLVEHSHGNLIAYLQGSSYAQAFLQQPIQFNLTPLGWIGGSLPLFVLPGVTRVACDVRAGMPEDVPQFIWRSLQEEKCLSGRFSPAYMPRVVSMAQRDIRRSRDDPSVPSPWKLTTLLLTGIPVNRAMVAAGLTLAHQVCVMYGATDAGTVASNIVTDSDTFRDYDAGKPFQGIQVKILNPRNKEQELPSGHVGLIAIKTPHFFNSYLNDPEATAAAFTKDGFFRTGDMGRLDEQGHLFAEGRGSDAIMRGDLVIHPADMEHSVLRCPGVTAVVIVGVPDDFLHEELCACVTLESAQVSMEHVRRFVDDVVAAGGSSSSYPAPRYYLRFDSFPLTDTGKPRRKELKSQATQRLCLSPN